MVSPCSAYDQLTFLSEVEIYFEHRVHDETSIVPTEPTLAMWSRRGGAKGGEPLLRLRPANVFVRGRELKKILTYFRRIVK